MTLRFLLATALLGAALLAPAAPATAAAPAADPATATATRPLRPGEILTPDDFATTGADAAAMAARLVGMETRRAVYAGQPIGPADVVPPRLIRRNALVTIEYVRGGLSISTEGRALDDARLGEPVRVMNLSSRTVVTGAAVAENRVRTP